MTIFILCIPPPPFDVSPSPHFNPNPTERSPAKQSLQAPRGREPWFLLDSEHLLHGYQDNGRVTYDSDDVLKHYIELPPQTASASPAIWLPPQGVPNSPSGTVTLCQIGIGEAPTTIPPPSLFFIVGELLGTHHLSALSETPTIPCIQNILWGCPATALHRKVPVPERLHARMPPLRTWCRPSTDCVEVSRTVLKSLLSLIW